MKSFDRCALCGLTNGEHCYGCPADQINWSRQGGGGVIGDVEECPDLGVVPTPTPFNSGLYRDAWGAGGGGGGQIGGTKAAQGTANDAIRDALEQALANPVEHPKSDPINPSHYREHPSGVECIQITEHMGFNLGNAIKYVWRADLKGRAIEDLEKSIWYIQREIDKRRKAALSQTP